MIRLKDLLVEAKPTGKAQTALYNLMSQFWDAGEELELATLSRYPAMRFIHFKDIQGAAKQLAKKGLITYDGCCRVALVGQELNEAKNTRLYIFKPIDVTKTYRLLNREKIPYQAGTNNVVQIDSKDVSKVDQLLRKNNVDFETTRKRLKKEDVAEKWSAADRKKVVHAAYEVTKKTFGRQIGGLRDIEPQGQHQIWIDITWPATDIPAQRNIALWSSERMKRLKKLIGRDPWLKDKYFPSFERKGAGTYIVFVRK